MVQVGKCAEASISLRQLKWVAWAVFYQRQTKIGRHTEKQEGVGALPTQNVTYFA